MKVNSLGQDIPLEENSDLTTQQRWQSPLPESDLIL